MNTDPKVLACVDQSPYADHVTDAAAWAAMRLDAQVELLRRSRTCASDMARSWKH